MTSKTTLTSVTFHHSFRLPGMERAYPPGNYMIETDTETLDSASQLAYRRVETRILLTHPGRVEAWAVDPKDLDTALLQDLSSSRLS